MWKPHPRRLVADWLGLMEPARCESFPLGQRRGPAGSANDLSHPLTKNLSTRIQAQQPEDENGDPPG